MRNVVFVFCCSNTCGRTRMGHAPILPQPFRFGTSERVHSCVVAM
jgi:hypothetical protein